MQDPKSLLWCKGRAVLQSGLEWNHGELQARVINHRFGWTREQSIFVCEWSLWVFTRTASPSAGLAALQPGSTWRTGVLELWKGNCEYRRSGSENPVPGLPAVPLGQAELLPPPCRDVCMSQATKQILLELPRAFSPWTELGILPHLPVWSAKLYRWTFLQICVEILLNVLWESKWVYIKKIFPLISVLFDFFRKPYKIRVWFEKSGFSLEMLNGLFPKVFVHGSGCLLLFHQRAQHRAQPGFPLHSFRSWCHSSCFPLSWCPRWVQRDFTIYRWCWVIQYKREFSLYFWVSGDGMGMWELGGLTVSPTVVQLWASHLPEIIWSYLVFSFIF